jgi:hypothetical protein
VPTFIETPDSEIQEVLEAAETCGCEREEPAAIGAVKQWRYRPYLLN